ncbi:hypothetical protein BC936DRAFT_138250, partial [Jimgerdemannia flammicorona]
MSFAYIKYDHVFLWKFTLISLPRIESLNIENTFRDEVQIGNLLSARQQFTVDTELADTTGDKVGILRAKVENQHGVEKLVHLGNLVLGGSHSEEWSE